MQKLRFQFLINSLTSGGAERIAVNLFNRLSEKYNIYFYTILNDIFYNIPKNIDFKSLTPYSINQGYKKFILAIFISFFKYLKETKKNDPKVLISFLEISNFITILVARLLNKRNIISIRCNPNDMYSEKTMYGKVHRFLIKLLYPKADKIVAVSKEIEEILIKEYKIPKEKIKTIYNPHSIEEYQKLSKEPLEEKYKEIFKDSFVFINIGRLTEQKGQWFLIRAFKKVSERHPEAKLIILGEGGLRNKLEKLIKKLNLEDKVFLLGRQDNVFKFLKNSDCFVFSSLWEGLPNTVIEALSVNLPIISTDCKTGPREILAPELDIGEEINYPYYGKYGILTKPFPRRYIFKTLDEEPLIEEEKILAELMIKIIKDKELREKYSNGLERAKDFDIDKIVKEWEGVIKKVLNISYSFQR
ncbi:glycosyl transferase group 1 [Methanocaldococcus infernus ME]|uniref:Glycosyl transferase group 1 n=1 Tax=Methanocaldococcus infernus (strain DSM 11812 / JCM 15783 / ME) TaxID=573063 RepID=D5VU56_METIM|nr:glycosyltransferase [Methanocaldococcus infernus]ADG14109.1 glycosyl transferase group 1 [Methanocaldococcus infernus ME]